ncbi:hypothetical protein ACVR0S_05485 [Streptococcus dentapri]|uniref:Uncharacterized protein n=1 Tax=Streptococcus dentapri TaxID=573564 RepID=A0ABV8CZY8_9STRE
MNKQDWIEYFEAINGRTPSAEELTQALAAGEYTAEPEPATPQSEPVQPQVQPQFTQTAQPQESVAGQFEQAQFQNQPAGQVEQTAQFQDPMATQGQFTQTAQFQQPLAADQFAQQQQATQGQFIQQSQLGQMGQEQFYQQPVNGQGQFQPAMVPAVPKQPNPQIETFKKAIKNYFSWFLNGFKDPKAKAEESHLTFGLITIGLSSLFMGWAFINFFRRFLMSFANITFLGQSLKENASDLYDNYTQLVAANFGFLKVLLLFIIFFIFYVLVTAGPVLLDRDKTKKFFTKVGQYFSYTPLLLAVNFLTFLATFIMPGAIKVTESDFSNSFSDYDFNPLQSFSLIGEVSSFNVMKVAVIIVGIFLIISFALILVALIKNIVTSFGKVNNFYVSVAALLIFAIICRVFHRILLAVIVSGFEAVGDSFFEIISRFL